MPRILRTRQSRADYVSIEGYIAQDSPANAAMIIRLFDERLKLLARNNLLGRPRPELSGGLRSWNVHRFVLFYRPIEDGVILVRVLHSSMGITREFFPELAAARLLFINDDHRWQYLARTRLHAV